MNLTSKFLRALVVGTSVASLSAAAGCATEAGEPAVGSTAQAAFDWGGDCSTGQGSFAQFIPQSVTTTIGDIPKRKRNVRIELQSDRDVDVQLIDKASGTEIIAWPSGLLNGPTEECTTFDQVEYCYSGYNGDGVNLGHEWIEVRGNTNRELAMKAYGYQSGDASVEYTWHAVDTCNEQGDGSFGQFIPHFEVANIGDIPANKVNVRIDLRSANDLDIQLFDGDVAIVKWPDGMLNGPSNDSVSYAGMNIVWSGYNGDGTGLGNEYIEIQGRVTRRLTMKAFGYAAGTAQVNYEWGLGTGVACGTFTTPPCGPGLMCKNGDTGKIEVDIPGACHTNDWCASDESAPDDCAHLIHIAVPGYWACTEEFTCKYETGPQPGAECGFFGPHCPEGNTCWYECPGGPSTCGINPQGTCVKECSDGSDCAGNEYCSSGGLCLPDGSCNVADDCTNEDNEWDSGACIATTSWQAKCDAQTCGFECIPL